MTGLKEYLSRGVFDSEQDGLIDTYIKKLEEHMNLWANKLPNDEWVVFDLTRNEVLRFLRGQTP